MERELYHYGVLGMKWGVRRTQAQLDRAAGRKSTKSQSEDDQRKESMKRDVKNRRTLTDSDIKKKIERIKLEKQLRELTDEEIAPGKAFAKRVMSNSGQKVASALVTGAMLYGVKAAMTKQFDIKELAGYMTPKPKNK